MRPVLVLAMLAALAAGTPAASLAIVKPSVSQTEGGEPDPAGAFHIPGETLFFTCRIANYTKSADSQIHVTYSVQAFDPQGVPLDDIYKNEFADEVTPQDRDWMPKIQTELEIPPLAPSGKYRIVVNAEDLLAHTAAQLEVPVEVRGRMVQPSEKLVVENFHFFHNETDSEPMASAVYRPGDGLWVKMDITGFGYGPGNKIGVSYMTSFLNPTGKVIWTQPEPAVDESESFYPKRYIPAEFGVSLQKDIRPGAYTILVTVKDSVGNQTCETKQTFTVE